MKYILFFILIIFTNSCGEKKSETDLLKDELNTQKKLIEEQNKKILEIENKQKTEVGIYDEEKEHIYNYEATEPELSLDLTLDNIIFLIDKDYGTIENFLIKRNWIFIEKQTNSKGILARHFKKLVYKNKYSDSEIDVRNFKEKPNLYNFKFKTVNQKNYEELYFQMEKKNFKLINPDNGRDYDLNEAVIGEKRLINSTSELYSDEKINISITYNTYIIVEEIDVEKGIFTYSDNSKFISYEFKFSYKQQ